MLDSPHQLHFRQAQEPDFHRLMPSGYPSPATDYRETIGSLFELVTDHPMATYLARVGDDRFSELHLQAGDLVFVDASRRPEKNDLVMAWLDEHWTLLRFSSAGYSCPQSGRKVPNPELIKIFGVVTAWLHRQNQ